MKTFLSGFGVGLLAAAIMIAAVNLYRRVAPAPSTPAPIAHELHGQQTQTTVVTSVQTFADGVKHKLGLPAAVQASPGAHVVAATQSPSSLRPQTVTAVLDASTGATSLYIRNDPLPWLALEQHGEASINRGFRGNTLLYRIALREDLLQIKAAHFGFVGSADSDGQWFAGVGIRVAW